MRKFKVKTCFPVSSSLFRHFFRLAVHSGMILAQNKKPHNPCGYTVSSHILLYDSYWARTSDLYPVKVARRE